MFLSPLRSIINEEKEEEKVVCSVLCNADIG
jgi:hypothetical protein